jgi:hypothetical protein
VAAVEATAAATEEDIKAVEAETGSRTTRTTIARSGMISCLEMGRSVRYLSGVDAFRIGDLAKVGFKRKIQDRNA